MRQPKRLWTAGRIVRSAARLALSLTIAGVFVLPLVWVIGASLRQPGLPPPRTIEWLPAPAAFGNYREIFELVRLDRFLLNSLSIVAVAVPLTLVTSSWAGFAMAQLPGPARRRFLILAVLLLMVPLTALWLPRFLLFNAAGLIDSLWALIAPALMGSSPLFILLFYWTFRRVPVELFESARLDGAGLLRIWASIAMPMARPTVVTVAVLAFGFYWSDFINPLLYIKSESRYPLPVGLQMLQQLDKTNWPLLMAAAVVMSVPMIVTFLAVQRYFWPENRLGGISGH
jgi:multiple sugar transport system permease protein